MKRFLLILAALFLLSSCEALDIFGKDIMLEPLSNVQSVRLYSYQNKDIKLSKEQKDAIVTEMNERLKSPWYQYFGKISNSCLVLQVEDNGRTRSFHIYENGRLEASIGGHGGAASKAYAAPDSMIKKLYDESEKCY